MYWRKKKAKLKELSNNISDRSEANGTGIMSDLLLVNGEARQLVANPHYTILLIGSYFSSPIVPNRKNFSIQLKSNMGCTSVESVSEKSLSSCFSPNNVKGRNLLLLILYFCNFLLPSTTSP